MGFIIDLIFLPINILVWIFAHLLGMITGTISGFTEFHFNKLFRPKTFNKYFEDETYYSYDPEASREIDRLAKQIRQMQQEKQNV